VEGTKLRLKAMAGDGGPFERNRVFQDFATAARELSLLVDEQMKDGFTEVSTPVWQSFLD
jgi:hypothetical protein